MQFGTSLTTLTSVLIVGLWDGVWTQTTEPPKITNETLARKYAEEYDAMISEVYYDSVVAQWNQATNITDYNKQLSIDASLVEAKFEQAAGANASLFDWKNFQDAELRRRFQKMADIGSAALALKDEAKLTKLKEILADMEDTYSVGSVCREESGQKKCYDLEPGLTEILAKSRDYDELVWVWRGWHDNVGRAVKANYTEFVELSNEAARINGYADTGDYWRSWYDTTDFRQQLERLYNELKPLYQNLHAYVKRKLMEKYGSDKFPKSGQIPAHLLGNMWAQQWNNIYDLLEPYKGKQSVDVTPELVKQGYDARRMFNLSDEFFTSLGLKPMPQEFWDESMIEKPSDGRKVVCHASAWDFYNQKDFRIKMCTQVNMDRLVTVHHEMGHVQYYLQYKDQPVVYRRGANPGFHEAVGDVLALSVATPKHLKEVGLLDTVQDDPDSDINFLMSQALDKIAFIPFGYLMDQWRWGVFDGSTPPTKYNEDWWKLRCKYQGVSPPVERTEKDFDPGAKYHIPANTPYIRYFVSYVLQFQFHKALCQAANQTGPLHKCDIYRSKEAGTLLGNMLKLGSSKPWPDALEQVTGTREMDATAIVAYFQPLVDWLKEQNKGQTIVWEDNCSAIPVPSTTPGPASSARFNSASIFVCAISMILLLCRIHW